MYSFEVEGSASGTPAQTQLLLTVLPTVTLEVSDPALARDERSPGELRIPVSVSNRARGSQLVHIRVMEAPPGWAAHIEGATVLEMPADHRVSLEIRAIHLLRERVDDGDRLAPFVIRAEPVHEPKGGSTAALYLRPAGSGPDDPAETSTA